MTSLKLVANTLLRHVTITLALALLTLTLNPNFFTTFAQTLRHSKPERNIQQLTCKDAVNFLCLSADSGR